MVIPVKIDGLEQSIFSRLSREQVRRRLWPRAIVTVLEPVNLGVPADLKGRERRQAAGTALYQIMSDLIFRTMSTDRSIVQALADVAAKHGPRRIAIEDPSGTMLSYRRMLTSIAVLGRKLMPLAPEGGSIGVMLPNSNAAVVTLFGLGASRR